MERKVKITKSQLKQIIKEEYVRCLLESKGYKATDSRVKVLAESIDEGFFSDLVKGLKAGKETYSSARKETKEKESAEKAAAALDKISSDLTKKLGDLYSSTAKDLESKAKMSMGDAAEKAQSMLTIAASKVVPSLEPAAAKEEQELEVDFAKPDFYHWLETGEKPAAPPRPKKAFGKPLPGVRTGSGQMRRAAGF